MERTKEQIDSLMNELLKSIPFGRKEFDIDQWYAIRHGLSIGLTTEQVKIYADPKYDWHQMRQIREGFEDGLTMEQIKLYLNPIINWDQMEQIRIGLNGLYHESPASPIIAIACMNSKIQP